MFVYADTEFFIKDFSAKYNKKLKKLSNCADKVYIICEYVNIERKYNNEDKIIEEVRTFKEKVFSEDFVKARFLAFAKMVGGEWWI